MTQDTWNETRRNLLAGGLGLGGAVLAGAARADGTGTAAAGSAGAIDAGSVAAEHVAFPPIHAPTERDEGQPPNPEPPAQRVGFAIMGLGRLALENILPAFAQCKHARPVALVSGDPDKLTSVAAQYGIAKESCYSYADFSRIRSNAAVQVVYVVLPNALHREAVVRAAEAGKHVLCEKPMAVSAEEARAMIEACRRAGRKLMIAYRCQYEANNRELIRRARSGELGDIQFIDAVNTQNQGNPAQWRQIKHLSGGGALPDVGLYCLNSTRALLGEEPIAITAAIHSPAGDARFAEVESTVSFTLQFPSGVIANCTTSYSAHEHRNLKVLGSSGSAEIENAFGYEGQRLRLYRRDGNAEASVELSLAHKNQFSLEIDHMAECVRHDTQPRTPGEEGLQDQVLMAAIYQAAASGETVRLAPVMRRDAFRGVEPAVP
jgi:predicted dehydrogenase